MPRYPGLLIASWALLGGGVLFFVTSVAGLLWPQRTPPSDLGLYAVTVTAVGLGLSGLALRWSKLHPPAPE